jgi:hypothetical protein
MTGVFSGFTKVLQSNRKEKMAELWEANTNDC